MRPITLFVFCSNALVHHAVMKHIVAHEMYTCKNETYTMGTLKDGPPNIKLILREPVKCNCSITTPTLWALEFFQPQFAFYLDLLEDASGNVLVSDNIVMDELWDSDRLIDILGAEWPNVLSTIKNVGRYDELENVVMADDIWAPAPAAGFFNALQSAPTIPGMKIMGVESLLKATSDQAQDANRTVQNLAAVSVGLWRLMNYTEPLMRKDETGYFATYFIDEASKVN